MKIVVTHGRDLTKEQKARLEILGEVKYYEDKPKDADEWLKRAQGFDVVCTALSGANEKWAELQNVFMSLCFVGVGWVDKSKAKERNITIANSPGCNRHAVSEWVIGMMILMARQISEYLKIEELPVGFLPPSTTGLAYKNITILGKGNIGTRVGEIAKAMEMNVNYFKRGDDLNECTKSADVVVDCLGLNEQTQNLLNADFFNSLKDGAMFITITNGGIVDIEAMMTALDSGKLSSVAHDGASMMPGDTRNEIYQKLLKHPKVFITPHIAYNSDVERRIGNDMMIENVEAFIKGKPQNIVE